MANDASKYLRNYIAESLRDAPSDAYMYHVSNNISFDKPVYRPGSDSYFALMKEARKRYRHGDYVPKTNDEKELFENSDLGEFGNYNGQRVPLDFPHIPEELEEAKYKGRDVTLGKKGASRIGGGRARVYVRDPDTGKVKKVEFGSPMADAMGDSDSDKKRRKNYGIRHKCADKKDKTKPGYWSCRATKLFGRNIPGWW
ncbi:MAG: hypothetical protein CMK38_00030 [Porticoccaceae bacterium]|nr:hypothetical protein [Porticoccaceae bacterium]|tara:strand:+ start:390 stop:986 length:597 start_codon:yes stop_codon:yes gene_type:complete